MINKAAQFLSVKIGLSSEPNSSMVQIMFSRIVNRMNRERDVWNISNEFAHRRMVSFILMYTDPDLVLGEMQLTSTNIVSRLAHISINGWATEGAARIFRLVTASQYDNSMIDNNSC